MLTNVASSLMTSFWSLGAGPRSDCGFSLERGAGTPESSGSEGRWREGLLLRPLSGSAESGVRDGFLESAGLPSTGSLPRLLSELSRPAPAEDDALSSLEV